MNIDFEYLPGGVYETVLKLREQFQILSATRPAELTAAACNEYTARIRDLVTHAAMPELSRNYDLWESRELQVVDGKAPALEEYVATAAEFFEKALPYARDLEEWTAQRPQATSIIATPSCDDPQFTQGPFITILCQLAMESDDGPSLLPVAWRYKQWSPLEQPFLKLTVGDVNPMFIGVVSVADVTDVAVQAQIDFSAAAIEALGIDLDYSVLSFDAEARHVLSFVDLNQCAHIFEETEVYDE